MEVRRRALVCVLFFCSGLSGLVYQVVWVRVFGNVFGNTVHSAALVVAVFMLGLGAGSYAIGEWADRRYAVQPESLLAAYGRLELAIGALGLVISAVLPHLGELSALASSYARAPNGWYVLSTFSYSARVAIAAVLLTPITALMGGTLTLLIRHVVRGDLDTGSRRIAVLYAVNTAGAALGCVLTDFLLVPAVGLLGTQLVAVLFNAVAGVGALVLARSPRRQPVVRTGPSALRPEPSASSSVALVSLALAMSGFAAMGMEMLWFRHFSILLGGFRAVFSLLMTVILAGIVAGSMAAGLPARRTLRPALWLVAVQGLFVIASLLGLAGADARFIEHAVTVNRASRAAIEPASGAARAVGELWFNARPILLEAGLPALLMGFAFPLANAVVQRVDRSVGRRAGVLYLWNTCGAVCGSLAAGFVLLPALGIQATATVLAMSAGLSIVPLYLTARREGEWADAAVRGARRRIGPAAATCLAVACGVAIVLWLRLPPGYVIDRAAPALENERLLARSEGLTEVVAVADVSGDGRRLLTNGHPMSSTSSLSQRYMRALVHIPLLSVENPERVLVIGFGVGNTTHAATLHPSVRRVEVADLSTGILGHADYFGDVNRHVLGDARVAVYVNDGRQHLRMQRPESYDLIALEPPPVGYAGVAALYSTEFYALARSRLRQGGRLSQWLPAYQVPAPVVLAMVRAFVDVFPQSVLVSGAEADLLLVGANDSRIEIDPGSAARLLAKAPDVQADLTRLDLGTLREIVGTFVGSAATLAQATRDTAPVTDDRPIQEYGVRSLLDSGEAVPAALVDLRQVSAWCPRCFDAGGKPVPEVDGLDVYLALADRAYRGSPDEAARARTLAERRGRVVAGSAYLGAIVPESSDVHDILGIALAERGHLDEAIAEFREALRLAPDSAQTHWHLGAALAYRGAREQAVEHLRRSVQLDPGNALARHDLDAVLTLDRRR